MSTIRIVKESPIYQGENEEIARTLDTEPWGGTPSDVTVVIYDSDGDDTSLTNLSGVASVASDVITLPSVIDLEADERYDLVMQFTSGGNILEARCKLIGEE